MELHLIYYFKIYSILNHLIKLSAIQSNTDQGTSDWLY